MKIKKYILIIILTFTIQLFAGNKYRVERVIIGSAVKVGEHNTLKFNVYNADELYYSFNVYVDYDIPYPNAYTFDNGLSAVVWSYDASIDFYNSEGELVDRINLLNPGDIEYERYIHADDNGKDLALVLSDARRKNSLVQLIGADRKLGNSWKLEYKNVTGVVMNGTGGQLAVSGYKFASGGFQYFSGFYTKKGNLLGSFNKSFRSGMYNELDTFTGFDNKNAFVIDTRSFEVIESVNMRDKEVLLDAVYFDNELHAAVSSEAVLQDGKWIYKNLQILSSENNKITSRKKLNTAEFSEVQFSTRADNVSVLIDKRRTVSIK